MSAQTAVDLSESAVAPDLRRQLDSQFKRRLPGASRADIDQAEKAFVDHLRGSSNLAADQLTAGRLDEDDLSARIDVFLSDHPELSGHRAAALEGPRAQIANALRQETDLARTDAEREALADRFVVWIGNLSGTARDNLLADRMSPEELQSRVAVFSADIRAERSRVVSDPAVAAVPAIAEAFERANLGTVAERADAICCRGTVTEGTFTRTFVLFKKRPGKIRMHIVENGIVVGVMAFDGATAWRQTAGKPAVTVHGSEAESLKVVARFDDPLVGYRERGAQARLESAPGASPIRLSVREPDGSEESETIDPATYTEQSISRRAPNGGMGRDPIERIQKGGHVQRPVPPARIRQGRHSFDHPDQRRAPGRGRARSDLCGAGQSGTWISWTTWVDSRFLTGRKKPRVPRASSFRRGGPNERRRFRPADSDGSCGAALARNGGDIMSSPEIRPSGAFVFHWGSILIAIGSALPCALFGGRERSKGLLFG